MSSLHDLLEVYKLQRALHRNLVPSNKRDQAAIAIAEWLVNAGKISALPLMFYDRDTGKLYPVMDEIGHDEGKETGRLQTG